MSAIETEASNRAGDLREAVRIDYARYSDIEDRARDTWDRISGVLDGYSLSMGVRMQLERARSDIGEALAKPEGCGISSALAAVSHVKAAQDVIRRAIINSPETADFMAGVPIEAAHQRERWPSDHDTGKSPFDWFWLIGYLAQKAAAAHAAGDSEKALHHTISTAAALANWHANISGASTSMRPGIETPEQGCETNG